MSKKAYSSCGTIVTVNNRGYQYIFSSKQEAIEHYEEALSDCKDLTEDMKKILDELKSLEV